MEESRDSRAICEVIAELLPKLEKITGGPTVFVLMFGPCGEGTHHTTSNLPGPNVVRDYINHNAPFIGRGLDDRSVRFEKRPDGSVGEIETVEEFTKPVGGKQ